MQALVIEKHGDFCAIEQRERALPETGPNQVRVRVAAVGLNHLDIWVRKGVAGHQFPLPLVPGSDVVGTVEEVGELVDKALLGRRVALVPAESCGSCERCAKNQENLCPKYRIRGEGMDGGCQEAVIAKPNDLLFLPDGMAWTEAAAFPLSALTAWHMLVERAHLQKGERVLVLAGASGVGSAAIQIARLLGAEVYATAGTPEKRALAKTLGAQEVFDHYTDPPFHKLLKKATNGAGADVIIEHTGEKTWTRSMRALAWGGRLVTCGATSGHQAEIDLRVLFFKQQSVLGSTMGTRDGMEKVWSHFCAGRLNATVGACLKMSEIAHAHALLEQHQVLGKVVLLQDLG